MAATWSGMRIVALPLTTRATSSFRASYTLPLTYYHFQTPLPKSEDKGKQSILKRVTGKAAETWAGLGRAPERSFKRRLFVYGEKLIDRIDFEELSLKGVDPSLGPRIGQLRRGEAVKEETLVQIPIFYPPSIDLGRGGVSPLPHMQSLLARRTPHHKKGFYKWLIIAPLTAPFALIPVIPNLPFFYAAWRAWSHYRAWKASEYMEGLITSNHVVPEPSPGLDEVYASHLTLHSRLDGKAGPATTSDKVAPDSKERFSHPPQPRLLLSRDDVPQILGIFKLPESAGSDILRALEQARVRIQKSTGD